MYYALLKSFVRAPIQFVPALTVNSFSLKQLLILPPKHEHVHLPCPKSAATKEGRT